jgi:hypothetical protein
VKTAIARKTGRDGKTRLARGNVAGKTWQGKQGWENRVQEIGLGRAYRKKAGYTWAVYTRANRAREIGW